MWSQVICLDILRSLTAEPHAASALLAELHACRGADARLDALTDDLKTELGGGGGGGGGEGAGGALMD